jgi:hypothetical protein
MPALDFALGLGTSQRTVDLLDGSPFQNILPDLMLYLDDWQSNFRRD